MKTEADASGFYESQFFGNFPRVQILTVRQIFNGQRLLYPQTAPATFKRAERQTTTNAEQNPLF